MTLDSIADFMIAHKPYFCRVILENDIKKHLEYGTITILTDDKGISGVMRFNMEGECCHVLDLIVRKDLERNNMIKTIAIKSWAKFPHAKFYRFERKHKYPYRNPVAHRLTQLLIKEK